MCCIALSILVISKSLLLQLALYLECFQNNGLWGYFGLLGIDVSCPLHGELTHRRIFPDIIFIGPLANGALNPALAAWLSLIFFTQDAVSLVKMEEEPEAAARKLTETAFSRGSSDNITCIVVKFQHDKPSGDSPSPSGDKSWFHLFVIHVVGPFTLSRIFLAPIHGDPLIAARLVYMPP